MSRQDKLAPGGIPRWIRCYDYGDQRVDRYTVVFTGRYKYRPIGTVVVLSMSEYPFDPNGMLSSDTLNLAGVVGGNKPGQWPPKIGRRGNLGLRITFADLPPDCQKVVWQNYADLWVVDVPEAYR